MAGKTSSCCDTEAICSGHPKSSRCIVIPNIKSEKNHRIINDVNDSWIILYNMMRETTLNHINDINVI